jgi:bla regulator protein BlaR1
MIHVLLNHLWQSTVFLGAAGLLTLALRNNGAHTRFWLWFAASCKFLIPFSLLSSIGSHLSWRVAPTVPVPPMVGAFVQPFSTAAVLTPVVATRPAPILGINWLLICFIVWACGTIAVGIYWTMRWLQIRAAIKDATPLPLDAPIPVKSSESLIEPGVVGLFRPVLLLPEGICERLTSKQLQTILVHELNHVRRRDNLTAAIHMVVEALFWFHPLVWWLGRRLIVEREGACHEAVIAAGGDREAYAEALLTVCKFYVESPLTSAAGVAGADLSKRIELIMTPRITHKLNTSRKALLAAAATSAILIPIVIGSMVATTSRAAAQTEGQTGASFQSVSIRESQLGGLGAPILIGNDTFKVQNYSLRTLIAFAYDVENSLIFGRDTLDAKYDIEAKAPAPFPSPGYSRVDAARAMIRNLLADQFQLAVHRDTKSLSAYILTSARANVFLKVAQMPEVRMGGGPNSISGTSLRMDDLVELLSQRLGHPVIDQTGLTETYDFKLVWKVDSSPTAGRTDNIAPAVPANPSPEVLAAALQTELGLRLDLQQTPAEVLIVDHVQLAKDFVPARKPVPMDPKLFDSYVGHYELPPWNRIMSVYRDNQRFWTQMFGQPPVQVFPEGQDNFFANAVNAQISFKLDAQGRASGLVLHQNGEDTFAPRIDDATAEQMIEALKTKAQQQVAAPGSEQALRQMIQELASGKPDYDRMGPELIEATREQLPDLQRELTSLGSLVTLKFIRVGAEGADIYKAEFEHGNREWRISIAADGKIIGSFYRPAP